MDDGMRVMKALLDDAIKDYMVLRGSQDFSRATLRNENGVLRRFLTVSGNIWMHSITERHVIRHFEDAGKTRAVNTLQLDHTVLAQFFEWARKTRRLPLDRDPLAGRRRPRMTKKERDRIHVSQFDNLLNIAGSTDPRDRAVVAVLLYTLLRESEAADLRVGDVDLDAGFVRARITKSRQEDDMPISSELDAELRAWLTVYSETIGPLRPDFYLLPRRKSVQLHKDDVGRIVSHDTSYTPGAPVTRPGRLVTPILESAGFPVRDHAGKAKGEGAHTLRRSGARALFDRLAEQGYDHSLRIVQSVLHHSSVTITEKYIGVTADRRSRDEILRGKPMYQATPENVVRLTV